MEKRVALLGIYHESNTFLSSKTSLKDFERGHLLYGDDIRSEYGQAYHEIGGMLEVLDQAGMEAVPLFFAEATPGGIITDTTLDFLLDKISAALKSNGPFEGILAAVHGAAVSESLQDMDGWWLQKIRDIAGETTPIIGTLDPHANVSQEMIDATDALVAYKTNPHIDQRATGAEAARLMVDTIAGKIRPTQYFCQPPATISIEQQYTPGSPCKELYAFVKEFSAQAGVLSASVLLGFPYADVKKMGSGFIVVADGDTGLARSLAERLCEYLWHNRSEFVGEKISIEEALASVSERERPVLLLDMGDNVGGGSPGDSTFILEGLDSSGTWRSFVCIYDPESVSHAVNAGEGSTLRLKIGGKTDTLHGQPYEVEVVVMSVADGVFKETQARHGGQVNYNMGTIAIVETAHGTTVMLTSLRIVPFSLRQLTAFGIDPLAYDVIVAKGVHAPMAAYQEVCKSFVRVNTRGITHADMTRLPFENRRKPLYPFENISL